MSRFQLLMVTILATASSPAAAGFHLLHGFGGGDDGLNPLAGLTPDGAGNLYGTTSLGGAHGAGNVFVLRPPADGESSWHETVIKSFSGGADGNEPFASVTLDASGAVFGATASGGKFAQGNVFELQPPTGKGNSWTETLLYSFLGNADGAVPTSALAIDPVTHVIYGTTNSGGTDNNGVVFSLTPPPSGGSVWREKTLHRFTGGDDGATPAGGVTIGGDGALYGTTIGGGTGDGVVFRLAPKLGGGWKETVLHRFGAAGDGAGPAGGITFDSAGNLYGTTKFGGLGGGTVFRLAPPAPGHMVWKESILHSFTAGTGDGLVPIGGVSIDAAGALYCTTDQGGAFTGGALIRLTERTDGSWQESVLYSFSGGTDGLEPVGNLTLDASGSLYGMTYDGGAAEAGTVFKFVQ